VKEENSSIVSESLKSEEAKEPVHNRLHLESVEEYANEIID